MNATFKQWKRPDTVYHTDLKNYLRTGEVHSRFGAYLTEKGGGKSASFEFILNGSFGIHKRKISPLFGRESKARVHGTDLAGLDSRWLEEDKDDGLGWQDVRATKDSS